MINVFFDVVDAEGFIARRAFEDFGRFGLFEQGVDSFVVELVGERSIRFVKDVVEKELLGGFGIGAVLLDFWYFFVVIFFSEDVFEI